MEVRAQPASPIALPPDEERRGKGRSEQGPVAHIRSFLVGGGTEERGSSTTAHGGEGRRKSGPIRFAADSERSPPHLPGNRPPPSPAHSLPREPQPGRLAPPRRPSQRAAAECARP